ncbi:hypothetical protein GCM10009860_01580 [Microbacterium mitrae]|uniref:HdeD family acid-resistance protein n=1 Tax=Microbacterium mitrae TaxID=664640 RepID=A0A5C8HQ13_9MICO|nr:DUF308 domain-containing protein [Microbacterium mitrae]TXK05577.1 hypothetical protein FVP60_00830 [Microbacterium mitrae]
MSDPLDTPSIISPETKSAALKSLKWLLGLGGALAIIVGALIFLWPTKSAVVITMIIAAYALVGGVFYLIIAFATKGLSTGARIGQALAGIIFIVAGIIAFMNPAESTVTFAFIVIIFIGVSWIFEGIAALTALDLAPSKGWAIFFAIVSILAGIAVLLSPLFAAAVLWMWLGISLFVIGIVQVVRAFTIDRD